MEICKICGKELKCVNKSHLQNKHNITMKEYKLMFVKEKDTDYLIEALKETWGL